MNNREEKKKVIFHQGKNYSRICAPVIFFLSLFLGKPAREKGMSASIRLV